MPAPDHRHDRSGLTLVEVLVVIAIIGLLVGLLMPAVSSARESGRKIACNNNLRQMALGSVAHLEHLRTFPSAGFELGTSASISGANGFHELQGGGWAYNLLPFIELGHLRDVPVGQVSGICPPIYRCPTSVSALSTRRNEASYSGCGGTADNRFAPSGRATEARYPSLQSPDETGTLYNIVDIPTLPAAKQEIVRQQACGYPHAIAGLPYSPSGDTTLISGWQGQAKGPITGVIAPFGRVRAAHVNDGLSKTFLVGELYSTDSTTLPLWHLSWTNGFWWTTVVYTRRPPVFAAPGAILQATNQQFGARHPDSCGMAMCDGSVRQVSFSVDPTVFRDCGTRNGVGDTTTRSVDN